jgi:hypothetical protein
METGQGMVLEMGMVLGKVREMETELELARVARRPLPGPPGAPQVPTLTPTFSIFFTSVVRTGHHFFFF